LNGGDAGMLQAPVVFRYDSEVLLYEMLLHPGTGSYHEDTIFRFTPDGGLRHVDFVRAPDAYPGLGSGEDVWKGERNVFTDDRMTFEFFLWNPGDANCCPNAGHVTGTYRLTRIEARNAGTMKPAVELRIEPDTFHREDIRE